MRTILAPVVAVALLAPAAEARAENPHGGHGQEPPLDPHARHVQPPPDPHAGHGQQAPPSDPHASHGEARRAPPPAGIPPPEAAFSGPRHAADLVFEPAAMAGARAQLRAEHGGMKAHGLAVDRFELQTGDGGEDYTWKAQAWYGGDVNKLRVKTEGEDSFGGGAGAAEMQLLWSRAVTPWFDLQAGVRYDWAPEPDRGYLVLGVQGLVPYLFEVDAAAFVSEEGDLSARFEAEYDLRITQRLVLRPAADVEIAAGDVPELGIGSGISAAELGLRLRYEVAPELAPYAGVEWQRKFGATADLARLAGEVTNDLRLVAGVKFWF